MLPFLVAPVAGPSAAGTEPRGLGVHEIRTASGPRDLYTTRDCTFSWSHHPLYPAMPCAKLRTGKRVRRTEKKQNKKKYRKKKEQKKEQKKKTKKGKKERKKRKNKTKKER